MQCLHCKITRPHEIFSKYIIILYYIIGYSGVNDDARVVVGVGREEAREAREDRELPEGGYGNFLTAFNKETTRTARISPLR